MTFNVIEDEEEKRIDIIVAERLSITRSASTQLIENGLVKLNGKPVKKNAKPKAGDTVEYEIPEPVEYDAKPENIPLDIVYEDDDLLVVNKRKGMVVHPAAGNPDGTLVNALMYHCKGNLSGINGVLRPGIVHRIDKDTSGLLLVAKNDAAHVSLAEQISSHKLERHYIAISNGHLKDERGTLDYPIGRHPVDRKKMAVVKDGREAVTHFEVIKRLNGFDYVKLRLETGRTHQIRVHLSHVGHPLLCDEIYGGGKTIFEKRYRDEINGQCLHAQSVTFVHPRTKELMHFDSPVPDYFSKVLTLLDKND